MQRLSLLLTAPRTLEWVSDELPKIQSDEILVKTIVGGISIGSELPQYRGTARQQHTMSLPRMTGYENVAEVLQVGADISQYHVGDRVFAFYGHRSHAILSENCAISVPDGITHQQALLAILSCDVSKGIRKANLRPEERVLITGGGAIGLLTLAMLRAYGIHRVDLVEPIEPRRGLAKEFGAIITCHPDEAKRSDAVYAVGIECSSRQSAFQLLQSKVADGGRIVILSDGNIEPLTLSPHFHSKELTIIGSSDGWDYHQHAAWYFDLLQRKNIAIDKIFDKTISFSELPDMFEALDNGSLSPQPTKVFIRDYE